MKVGEVAMDEVIAAIDVGTAKTAVVIAEETDVGLAVRGFGSAPNEGVVRGVVANVSKALKGIRHALSQAEKQAQLKVRDVVAVFGGAQVKVIKSHGVTTIPRDRGKVTADDVAKVIEAAEALPLPQDAQIIDFAVSDFTADGQGGVVDPTGMIATRLEGDVLVFVAPAAAVRNLTMALEDVDLVPTGFVASSVAVAEAVLTEEERELGAVVIDIGAGVTNAAIYKGGRPKQAVAIPYAGESITHDLMVGLKLTRPAAEEVKLSHGCAVENTIPEDELVEIMGIGGREPRKVKKRFVGMIVEARLEEIMLMVKEEFEKVGFKLSSESLPAGVVLTGGTSLMPQVVFLAERVFGMPVRLGLPGDKDPVPQGMRLPDFPAAWGALLVEYTRRKTLKAKARGGGGLSALWNRIKRWVLKNI